jgi:hypothetical protein
VKLSRSLHSSIVAILDSCDSVKWMGGPVLVAAVPRDEKKTKCCNQIDKHSRKSNPSSDRTCTRKQEASFHYCQLLENNVDTSQVDISMFLDTEVSGMGEHPPKSPQTQSAMEFDRHCSE